MAVSQVSQSSVLQSTSILCPKYSCVYIDNYLAIKRRVCTEYVMYECEKWLSLCLLGKTSFLFYFIKLKVYFSFYEIM